MPFSCWDKGEPIRINLKLPNLTKRFLTAAVGIPVTLWFVVSGGWSIFLLALVIGIIALLEFYSIAQVNESFPGRYFGCAILFLCLLFVRYGVAWSWFVLLMLGSLILALIQVAIGDQVVRNQALKRAATLVCGAAYIGLPLAALLGLRLWATDGALWLLLVLVLTWATDSFSYFSGRWLGKRLLAPRISPKKTIEGALGGWLGGSFAGLFTLQLGNQLKLEYLPLIILAPFVAIIGDLWESGLKRYFQSKDSRLVGFNLFPGHGGVLDRIDSLLFVAPTVVLYLSVTTAIFRPGV